MEGLEGIRVVELGHMVSAAHATKIMADLGADVVKVEEPTGDIARLRGPFLGGIADPEKSGLFLYLNTNKRGVTLDLTDLRERPQLERLAEWAEIIVHNYTRTEMAARGLDYERLRAINPRLVLCSITPFGLTGPHRDYRAEEITMAHGGGWAWVAPGASDRPELPPLKASGHQSDFHAGLSAAVASLGAYFRALASGRGEHVDLSVQAHVASFIEQNLVYFTYSEKVASRLGQRMLFPWGIFECADGLIFLVIVEEDQWQRLLELMGNPEWASWEIFRGLVARADNADAMKPYIMEWTRQWKVKTFSARVRSAGSASLRSSRWPTWPMRRSFARVNSSLTWSTRAPGGSASWDRPIASTTRGGASAAARHVSASTTTTRWGGTLRH